MIIPWNTDAPIYYFPWATLGLIAANTAVLVGLLAAGDLDEADLENWLLVYGQGLHPLQWVTSAFIHADIFHLVGNMIFLWAFGLVVEGKLGWWRFLLVYLGLGIVQNAAEQSMSFWFTEGASCGASAIIFGIMTMALVWAPENEMNCVGWFWFRPFAFDIRILWLALLYIGEEILWVSLTGFSISSELFHSLGAVLGFGLGVGMLKLGWVDCEGWDLISVMAGRHLRSGSGASVRRAKAIATGDSELDAEGDPLVTVAQRREQALEPMRRLLAGRKGSAALALYHKTVHLCESWELPERELLQLVELLCGETLWEAGVHFLEDYLRRFQKRIIPVRLRLAQILIEQQQRPSYAARVLAELPESGLGAKEEKLRSALESKSQKLIDEGVLELEGRAW
jgi:membrane associated rhomboid family serine protease